MKTPPILPRIRALFARVSCKSLKTTPLAGLMFPFVTTLLLTANLSSGAATDESSSLFHIGDRVQTRDLTAVWSTPPTSGRFAGTQLANTAGSITDGPVQAAQVWWWKARFDNGSEGWIAERKLSSLNGPFPSQQLDCRRGNPPPSNSFVALFPPNGSTVDYSRVTARGVVTNDIYAGPLISFSFNGNNVTLDAAGGFSFPLGLHPGMNTFTLQASTPNPRQQPNVISGYLDGSVIYGTDAARAAALRTFQGGKLATSTGNLPPLNTAGFPNANDAHLFPDNELFLAGDVRANENVELTAIHALFVREHNQIASAIAAADSRLNDEQVFQLTRRIVVAELQSITYNEFLPALLGPNALRPYYGYNPNVNAGIAIEFSTAAFRIGHTLVNDDVEFLDNDGNPVHDELELAEAFFNPGAIKEAGPDPVLKYLATDNAREVDTELVPGLRNFLFGPPGQGGFDLASLNIQRGRDHGLSDYDTTRVAYGLPRVTSFDQITSNADLQTKLAALYGNVDSIDLWVGGLAEDHVSRGSVGPTFQKIIANQFERIRDGDRNWYQRTFCGTQRQAIEGTRLSDIIRRNTSITKLQDNVFFFDSNSTLASLQSKAGSLLPTLIYSRSWFTPATLNGTGNNPVHPNWAAAGADLMRFAPAAYADGISVPAGQGRPGPRLVSNTVCEQTTDAANARNMSDWVYGWGQFIDHDLDLTPTDSTAFDVPVPAGDPYFDPNSTGTAVILFSRSVYDANTGSATPNVQEQDYTIYFRQWPWWHH